MRLKRKEFNDEQMVDDDQQRGDRKTLKEMGLNRNQRRNIAKRSKLFKDRSGEAWRMANKHMKGDKQQKAEEHRLGD